jgi:hypothetical protein
MTFVTLVLPTRVFLASTQARSSLVTRSLKNKAALSLGWWGETGTPRGHRGATRMLTAAGPKAGICWPIRQRSMGSFQGRLSKLGKATEKSHAHEEGECPGRGHHTVKQRCRTALEQEAGVEKKAWRKRPG